MTLWWSAHEVPTHLQWLYKHRLQRMPGGGRLQLSNSSHAQHAKSKECPTSGPELDAACMLGSRARPACTRSFQRTVDARWEAWDAFPAACMHTAASAHAHKACSILHLIMQLGTICGEPLEYYRETVCIHEASALGVLKNSMRMPTFQHVQWEQDESTPVVCICRN
jgi:hypothetical protein